MIYFSVGCLANTPVSEKFPLSHAEILASSKRFIISSCLVVMDSQNLSMPQGPDPGWIPVAPGWVTLVTIKSQGSMEHGMNMAIFRWDQHFLVIFSKEQRKNHQKLRSTFTVPWDGSRLSRTDAYPLVN